MEYILRNKPRTTIGLEITDSCLFFVTLNASGTQLLPIEYGSVDVADAAIDGGVVVDRDIVIDSLKQVRAQTSARYISCTFYHDELQADEWRELLAIAGFGKAHVISIPHAIGQLLGDNTGYFTTPSTFVLLGDNPRQLAYPFDAAGLLDIQTYITSQREQFLQIVGHLPRDPHETKELFEIYGISVTLPAVWRNCFDLSDYVPDISFNDSFGYTAAIAGAYTYARYTDTSSERDISTAVLKKPVLVESTAQAFGADMPTISPEHIEPPAIGT